MSHTPHELAADFPEYAEKIQALKASDAHFAKLHDAYHEVNRQVHRAETDVEPTGDEEIEAMRRERVKLKDELYAILSK
ncbi:YdcH family protein [Xanthobacter dioxanivorans]|uniref:YdcH family protein n=1 Tax=Xanthobacter dioxanivorans TaxID=2528964 RepID=A0A974SI10_9HYPH|nr:YdcH family protein [Xanthobacter dioxanivorans]QRG05694.1 YdcH family protein [Xanthobacter dioxanivorans]